MSEVHIPVNSSAYSSDYLSTHGNVTLGIIRALLCGEVAHYLHNIPDIFTIHYNLETAVKITLHCWIQCSDWCVALHTRHIRSFPSIIILSECGIQSSLE